MQFGRFFSVGHVLRVSIGKKEADRLTNRVIQRDLDFWYLFIMNFSFFLWSHFHLERSRRRMGSPKKATAGIEKYLID